MQTLLLYVFEIFVVDIVPSCEQCVLKQYIGDCYLFCRNLALEKHLTPSRNNGVQAIVARIKELIC